MGALALDLFLLLRLTETAPASNTIQPETHMKESDRVQNCNVALFKLLPLGDGANQRRSWRRISHARTRACGLGILVCVTTIPMWKITSKDPFR